MDTLSLNSCWSSDSSWQLLAMEESGALLCQRHGHRPVQLSRSYSACILPTCLLASECH